MVRRIDRQVIILSASFGSCYDKPKSSGRPMDSRDSVAVLQNLNASLRV